MGSTSHSTYSLRRRLLVSVTCLLIIFLGLMGLFLHNAFKQSVLDNAYNSLKNNILLLVSVIEVENQEFQVPTILPEPRLTQVDSGLYAQVVSSGNNQRWDSVSLLDEIMPELKSAIGEYHFIEEVTWETQEPVYGMSLGVVWETEQGELPLTIQVMERNKPYVDRLKRYQKQLWYWLGSLGFMFLALQFLLLGWALKPLRRVTTQVSEIESAERSYFDEDYPKEVSRLTQSLNNLLKFEEQQINRHKEVLGNLAHSLKTPLAVLKGLQYQEKDQVETNHQLSSMQDIIDYQLQSASAVGRRHFAKPILVDKSTRQVIDSLVKLNKDKGLRVISKIEDNVIFYGDKGDWMEVAGNIIDNSFKWAASEISVTLFNTSPHDQSRKQVTLIVEDDGVGIDENVKEAILSRGVRLDTQTPGQGLGLSIVKNIVNAYDGKLQIKTSSDKGVIFEVTL